ncbi:MAG: hypothetical protein GYB37_12495, partial [Algicola sp.]|nr:hypothetical protein [Algicola sp.]
MVKGFKTSDVGLIPDDWETETLFNCLEENPKYGIGAAAIDYNTNFPTYLRITDIDDSGLIDTENLKSVNHPESSKYYLEEGDIVLARTGASVGKSYLYNIDDGRLVYAGFLIKVRPNKSILKPQFLKGFLSTSTYWDWVVVSSMRSGQPGINSQQIGSLTIPLPSIKEQTVIATALSDMDGLIAATKKLIAKKEAIKQGLMQELLSGKKRLPRYNREWVKEHLGRIISVYRGGSPRPISSFIT